MLAVFSLLFVCGALWNGRITLGSNCLGKSVYTTYGVGFLGTAIVLTVCAMLPCDSRKRPRYLLWMGEHSFYFMAMHVPVISVIANIISKMLGVSRKAMSHSVPYSIAVFLISLAATSLAVKIFIDLKCSLKKHIHMRQNKGISAANDL